jgi:hypothetical protein
MTAAVAISSGDSFLAYNDKVLVMGSFRDSTLDHLKDKLKRINCAIDRGDFALGGDSLAWHLG